MNLTHNETAFLGFLAFVIVAQVALVFWARSTFQRKAPSVSMLARQKAASYRASASTKRDAERTAPSPPTAASTQVTLHEGSDPKC